VPDAGFWCSRSWVCLGLIGVSFLPGSSSFWTRYWAATIDLERLQHSASMKRSCESARRSVMCLLTGLISIIHWSMLASDTASFGAASPLTLRHVRRLLVALDLLRDGAILLIEDSAEGFLEGSVPEAARRKRWVHSLVFASKYDVFCSNARASAEPSTLPLLLRAFVANPELQMLDVASEIAFACPASPRELSCFLAFFPT
jgi:hypothetical protein